MIFYYCGLNCSSLFKKNGDSPVIIENFQKIPFEGLTNFEIGWNFSLLWKNSELFVSGKNETEDRELLKIPEFNGKLKNATIGADNNVCVLTEDDEIWQYKVYKNSWKKIPTFLNNSENETKETVVQMLTTKCTLVLTNLGRVFSIPTLIDMEKRLKFVQIAGGFDHTIMLTENGEVHSMGMGTRGQLGHGDLEDCENPKKIEALAGLKIIHISAGGWHNAVITDQGDLYTWGWNTSGELGIVKNDDSKICATPHVVDFQNEDDQNLDVNIERVDCGNNFTVCCADDQKLWGCGSNKYGQLGLSVGKLKSTNKFVKLEFDFENQSICNFKCREWGTCVIVQ